MEISVRKVDLQEILPLRQQYLDECQCQIRYNACHDHGWSDSYLVTCDRDLIGYGCVKGRDELSTRDAIFEFYLVPAWRLKANQIFNKLLAKSKVRYLECQTNDALTTQMVFEFGHKLKATTILFENSHESQLMIENAQVRLRTSLDPIFEKNKDTGSYVLTIGYEVVASGGFLLHYNLPYADLYMETRHDRRGLGYASFLLQEIKKHCHQAGRIPAARCRLNNQASKAALQKAGMSVCGYMLSADLK